MSERVEWMAIAGWSTFVAIQVGTAIYNWMTTRNRRDIAYYQKMADRFEAKCRGSMMDESMRGFRMWLICDVYCFFFGPSYTPVESPLPMDGNWSEWAEEEPTSVFMVVKCPIPNATARQLLLRRYSLIKSKIYVDIARVTYGDNWITYGNHAQLDERTVALWFERQVDDDLDHISTIMMILIDVQQRSQWQFEMPSPPHMSRITHVSRGGSRGDRLRIVYVRYEPQSEIITADYDLIRFDNDPSRLIAEEVSQQSIVFPNRQFWPRPIIGIPFAAALSLEGVQGASDLIISIDARGDLHGWPKDEGVKKFRESNFGQRLFKACNDFRSILPVGAIYIQYCLRHKYMLAVANNNVFFQRPLSVPSMGRLAADAICRARPNADLSMLEKEIGFDIFDGIIHDQEKPVLTTTLL